MQVGLATDIELIDGYPPLYCLFMRQHRWTGVIGSSYHGLAVKTPIILSKWKMIDNLRSEA